MIRLTAILICLTLLLGWEASAHADELKEQLSLFASSKEAARGGDYDHAIALMKSALALGELNILYLNLGRLYFKAGRCDEALEAYNKAATAPQAPSPPAPPAEAIRAALGRYRAELAQGCSAQLTVECDQADINVKVGSTPLQCGATLSLDPGTHRVTATQGARVQEVEVTLAAMQKKTLPFTMGIEPIAPDAAAPTPAPSVLASPAPAADDTTVLTLALGGAGAASIIAGAGVLLAIQQDFDDLEELSDTDNGSLTRYNLLLDRVDRRRIISGALFGMGGALLLTAGGIAWWDDDAATEEAPMTTFDLSPSQGGWVITVGGRY